MTKEQRDELRRLIGPTDNVTDEWSQFVGSVLAIRFQMYGEVDDGIGFKTLKALPALLDEIDRLERAKDFPEKFAMQNTLHQQAIEIARLKAENAELRAKEMKR
jgi:hypothetical protein